MFKDILLELGLLIILPACLVYLIKIVSEHLANNLFSRWNKFLLISTIVHELSHLLFACLFLLKIDSVSLFKINYQTGELGHVNYSYNELSKKDKIGATFTGLGPVLVIISILSFLYYSWFDISGITNLFNDFNIFTLIKEMFNLIFPSGKFSKVILFYLIFFILSPGLALSNNDLDSVGIGAKYIIIIAFISCFIGTTYFDWPTQTFFNIVILLNFVLLLTIFIELIVIGLIYLIDLLIEIKS